MIKMCANHLALRDVIMYLAISKVHFTLCGSAIIFITEIMQFADHKDTKFCKQYLRVYKPNMSRLCEYKKSLVRSEYTGLIKHFDSSALVAYIPDVSLQGVSSLTNLDLHLKSWA